VITGPVLVVAGLALGLYGAVGFNVGRMMAGWIVAGIGVVVFVAHFVHLP
jgi:hypothetical protein